MFGLFSSALSGCQGACELSFGVRVAGVCCDDSSGGGEVQVFVDMCDGVRGCVCVCFLPGRSTSPANCLCMHN